MTALALLPLGSPPGSLLERLDVCLSRAFGLRARTMACVDDPPEAFDATRGQWNAVAVLRSLLDRAGPDGERLLGITERDLFVPVLTFVYGQAQLRGRVAVVSLARLRPEFHGLRPDPELLAARAAKEAVHEVGHALGLVHCLDRRCPMALSLGLEDLDFKTAAPCPSCAALLKDSFAAPGHASTSPSTEGFP
jgi:archaemetzincin